MRIVILTAFMAFLVEAAALAQTTSFKYQGKLELNGSPVSGETDLRFTLYDAEVDGLVVAGPFYVNDLPVSGGLLSTSLNFGASTWDGSDRWMEAAIRPGDSAGDYTVLTPRQQIQTAPYATLARTVKGSGVLGPLSPPVGSAGAVSYGFAGDANTGMFSPGSNQLSLATVGVDRLHIDASGNVGIGKASGLLYRLTVADTNHQIAIVDTDDAKVWTLSTVSGGAFGIYQDGATQRLAIQADGTVTVEGGKAVVYSSNSGELMQFRAVATLSGNYPVNAAADGSYNWGNVGFTSPPSVFVGNFQAGPAGPGDFDKFHVICHDVTTTGCKVRIVNHGSTSASISEGKWSLLVVGPR